jgi:hypothetical protein
MQYIRKQVLAGEVMMGIGANLGSSLTVEMIGAAVLDGRQPRFVTNPEAL